ncbi:MAG: sugar porter family MFS transporter [Luteolibacter sp.]|uniref:sugar porter family MFS transporter n=1 Tax=Luteolibacter sp. TaxID=1962973 RepID=UPI0032650563
MNPRIFFFAIVSALAGFLFGFDTVVISGAEQTIQKLWGLSPGMHGIAMAAALYGTVIGSLAGGWPTDRFGRRATLLWIGALYLISALGCGFATDVNMFIAARFIGGLGIGISTVAAPLYISEIAPPAHRGRLAGMFQFNIVFGIVIAFLSNALLAGIGPNAWRWMLGVAAVPSVIYTVMCFAIPESPRWLLTRKGDRAKGLAALRVIEPNATDSQLEAQADLITSASSGQKTSGRFWTWGLRVPIMLAFFVAFFNQLSGINAILYFAPRIFEMTGLGEKAALLQSVGIGITNLVFTFVGLWLIDRMGRRTLLLIGSFGYIASLGLCALAFSHWAPQFKVASTAIAVVEMAPRVEKADAESRTKVEADFSEAKTALLTASADPRYEPGPVLISDQATPDDVKSVAEMAMTRASESAGSGGMVVMLCIFAFIASHAVGQGAVIWVLISEIFPNRHRAEGQALGSFTHWIFAALLTTFFPKMVTAFSPATVFAFFCGMMVLQLLWVIFSVPETKGIPLEDIQKKLGIS